MTAALLVVAVVVAAIDWYAVTAERPSIEYAAKPAVMVILLIATLALPGHEATHTWVLFGLALSLVGDIVLMLPRGIFEAGLGAFLLAHLAYVAAFAQVDQSASWAALGAVAIIAVGGLVGRRIVGAARDTGGQPLAGAVAAYILVIGAMGVSGFSTASPLLIIASTLFVLSDSLLGWGRFVARLPYERLLVHSTYHLAQIGFVLWLL